MALRAVSRVGSVMRFAPQLSVMGTRNFANFDERERGEEVLNSASASSFDFETTCISWLSAAALGHTCVLLRN